MWSTSARCEYSTPFGIAGRAGRVAHRGGGALVGIGQLARRLPSSRSATRIRGSRRRTGFVAPTTMTIGTLTLGFTCSQSGQQAFVHEDRAILGVVDDVGELVGVEAEVERVEHAAHQRDAEVGLEVRAVVPAERGDAVAGRDAEIEQDPGEAAGAVGEVGAGVAADRLVGECARRFPGGGRPFPRGGRSSTA